MKNIPYKDLAEILFLVLLLTNTTCLNLRKLALTYF